MMLFGPAIGARWPGDEGENGTVSAGKGRDCAMTATVVVLEGSLAGKKFVIGSEPLTFGRGDENDIVLSTPSASRLHAELRREATGYVLYDRGSTNGTWVNGAAVTVRPLVSGDRIQIGDDLFRFDVVDARTTLLPTPIPAPEQAAGQAAAAHANATARERVLRVTVAGGGP